MRGPVRSAQLLAQAGHGLTTLVEIRRICDKNALNAEKPGPLHGPRSGPWRRGRFLCPARRRIPQSPAETGPAPAGLLLRRFPDVEAHLELHAQAGRSGPLQASGSTRDHPRPLARWSRPNPAERSRIQSSRGCKIVRLRRPSARKSSPSRQLRPEAGATRTTKLQVSVIRGYSGPAAGRPSRSIRAISGSWNCDLSREMPLAPTWNSQASPVAMTASSSYGAFRVRPQGDALNLTTDLPRTRAGFFFFGTSGAPSCYVPASARRPASAIVPRTPPAGREPIYLRVARYITPARTGTCHALDTGHFWRAVAGFRPLGRGRCAVGDRRSERALSAKTSLQADCRRLGEFEQSRAPWSSSIGIDGRHASEPVVFFVGMPSLMLSALPGRPWRDGATARPEAIAIVEFPKRGTDIRRASTGCRSPCVICGLAPVSWRGP
jgi:hypothetical protein